MSNGPQASPPVCDPAAAPPAPDAYEPPAVTVLGTVQALTRGGANPITDGVAGAS